MLADSDALVDALVLATPDALDLKRFAIRAVLADSLALVEALCDADVLALVEVLCDALGYLRLRRAVDALCDGVAGLLALVDALEKQTHFCDSKALVEDFGMRTYLRIFVALVDAIL